MEDRSRVRLRLPTGLELEAEGRPAFVQSQIQELLALASPPKGAPAQGIPELTALSGAVTQSNGQLALRALALQDPMEACLILILASEKLLAQAKPAAAQLARWLRTSGYPVKRVDRILSKAVRTGQVLASGTKRARKYELSAKGRVAALLAAERLVRTVSSEADAKP